MQQSSYIDCNESFNYNIEIINICIILFYTHSARDKYNIYEALSINS